MTKKRNAMEFTRELVIKKIEQIFPKKDKVRILSILDMYGITKNEPFRERVQLAALKLSEGKEEELLKHIKHAKVDHYDIIFPAEEPNFYGISMGMSRITDEEKRILQEKDRKQYLDWLYGEK